MVIIAWVKNYPLNMNAQLHVVELEVYYFTKVFIYFHTWMHSLY